MSRSRFYVVSFFIAETLQIFAIADIPPGKISLQ